MSEGSPWKFRRVLWQIRGRPGPGADARNVKYAAVLQALSRGFDAPRDASLEGFGVSVASRALSICSGSCLGGHVDPP